MFRIFTEDVNRDRIESILASKFDSFTIIPAAGRWNGNVEPSLVIEIEGVSLDAVRTAAEEIKSANSQAEVMIARLATDTLVI
jgi:hypothetical protein